MKIDLKLKADQVFYLEKKLNSIGKLEPSEFIRLSRAKKNEHSLLIECLDKLESKSKAISRKATIFDEKKKYSISFKYHEASILNILCCGLKDLEDKGSHYSSLANSIYLIIDKKL